MFDSRTLAGKSILVTGGGSGLGLAISKSFVELHGGALTIRSTVGQGTEVTVTFPLRQAAARVA
jgi:signal transduction histidine kinase